VEKLSFEDHIARNKRVTVFIIVFMFALLYVVIYAAGYLLGAPPEFTLLFAAVFAAGYLIFAWSSSTKTVLRAAGAEPLDPKVRQQKLFAYKVEEMAIAAGLPVPGLYIQKSRDINAFVTGLTPEKSVMVVTQGALDQLSQEEMEGVVAHEMSHILNSDMRLATITVGVVGAIAMIAEIGVRLLWFGGGRRGGGDRGGHPALIVVALVALVLAPIFSRLTYLFMSRKREYLADATGAQLTRNPHGLAAALEKIRGDIPDDPKGSRTVSGLYIANPFKRQTVSSLWSTHPPLDERITRLRNM